jgi:multiple sugar transport system permease protein
MSPMYWLKRALIYTALIITFVIAVFPIVWVVLTSIKEPVDCFAIPPKWFFRPTLESYQQLFKDGFASMGIFLWKNMANSLIIAISSTLLTMFVSCNAAYGLSRFNFPGKKIIAIGIIATRMLPPVATMIPFFLLIHSLNLLDTKLALIMVYTALNIPLTTWMLRGFFDEVPKELDEAAMVDGCTRVKLLWGILTPLIAPGLVATSVFSFLLCWNEFSLALVLAIRESKTLPLIVTAFITDEGIFWGPMSAAATVVLLPPVIFMLLSHNKMGKGLTMGAVKG